MNTERDKLISDLREIQNNGYAMEDAQKQRELLSLMLRYIGDADPELRDELIYNTMSEWITEREYFDGEQLKAILSVLIDDEHLLLRIGSDGDASVFTRTFSALGVVLILIRHRAKAFLSAAEFSRLFDRCILYYTCEKDLSGYDAESGWAHAAAHGADIMDELVQCVECGEKEITEILYAFKTIMYNGKYIFQDEEDERISRVVFRIIKGKLVSAEAVSKWLEDLSECTEWELDRAQYVARVNAKNLLRSLYFRVTHCGKTADAAHIIFKAEENVNRFLQRDKELYES